MSRRASTPTGVTPVVTLSDGAQRPIPPELQEACAEAERIYQAMNRWERAWWLAEGRRIIAEGMIGQCH